MVVKDEAALNLAIIRLKISYKKIRHIEVEENEVNIIFNISGVRYMTELIKLLPEIDRIYNHAQQLLKRYFENPDEIIFNKSLYDESGYFERDSYIFPPLFHVTSSFFLESIKENGLGGASLHEQYKLEEMADDIYNGFVKRGLFPKMTQKNDENFWSNGIAWITKKFGNDNELIRAFGNYQRINRSYVAKQTCYAYGEIYLATEDRMKSYSKMRVGEYLGQIVDMFKLYYKKTGEFFRFNDSIQRKLIDEIFDYDIVDIKASIKPVILIVENILTCDLLKEGAGTYVKLPRIITKDMYRAVQESYIYIGGPIPADNITVVDDFSMLEDTLEKIYDKYTIGNSIVFCG